jgi:hypothetical protein
MRRLQYVRTRSHGELEMATYRMRWKGGCSPCPGHRMTHRKSGWKTWLTVVVAFEVVCVPV